MMPVLIETGTGRLLDYSLARTFMILFFPYSYRLTRVDKN
jgi:hypothetical protein